jgi:hypothetical protein
MRPHIVSAFAVTVALLFAAAVPAAGQGAPPARGPAAPPQAAKPYKMVAIAAPAPVTDPSFEAFRKQLGAIADKKDRKALAGLVSQTFFWQGEKGDKADKKQSGINSLARAIELDSKEAPGWEMLASAAEDPTAAQFPDRKDTICAPADPNFNAQEFDALVKATGTEDGDWAYPSQAGVEVRSGPQPKAEVIDKLGMHFVHVMHDDGPGNQQNPMLRVMTPSGKVGFVPADALSPLGNDQLCYSKEGGGWKISGFIGGDQ